MGACGDPFSWTLSPSCDVCGGVLGQGVVDVELVGGALSWLAQVGEGGGPLDESLKRGLLGVRRKRTNSPVGRIGMG